MIFKLFQKKFLPVLIPVLIVVYLFFGFNLSLVMAQINSASRSAQATIQENRITQLKNKALAEIDRRIQTLNRLQILLGQVKKLTDSDRTALFSLVQSDLTSLTALKTKIRDDQNLASLKTDVSSISKDYRVYLLVVPKVHLIVASDRMLDNADRLASVSAKLEERITQVQTSGKDTSALQASYQDMLKNIQDAKTQAQLIHDKVIILAPSGYPANKSILLQTRELFKGGRQSLQTAHKDAVSIVQGLKALK